MSLTTTQPIDLTSCELFDLRDYPVFVPPKPKANLKLQLPSSLSALKLDLSRLWLMRTPRRPQLEPKLRQPEQHFPAEDNDQFRVRTPVFTRPSVPDAKPPSPDFILPMPMPIKLPQLLSLNLTMALPEPETVYNRAEKSSFVSSTVGDVDSVNLTTRVWEESVRREVRDARYVAPLLRSPPPQSRDVVELSGWEREWNLIRLGSAEDDWKSEDGDEELDNDDDLEWHAVVFDEAYLGDAEDDWTDNEDETTFQETAS